MRVRSKASQPRLGPQMAWLVASAALLAACSSAAIDDPNAADAPAATAGSASGGSGSVVPMPSATAGSSTAPISNAPTYQKQDYPAGPYGTGLHATLEDFAFLGWHDPVAANYDASKLEQVRLSEYYNPDGRSDVKLIWINASAVWCSVCRAEMTDIKDNGVHASFGPRGVQMIVTLFEDNKSGPARPSDLHN